MTVNVSLNLSLDESHSIVYALVNTAEEKADKKYLDVATNFATQAGNGLDEYFQGLIDELGLDYVPSSVAPVGVVEPETVAVEPVVAPSPVVEPVATEAPAPVVEPEPVVAEPSPVVEPVVEPSSVETETPVPVEVPVTEPTS